MQDPLASEILEGRVKAGDHIRVDVDPATQQMKFVPVGKKSAEEKPAGFEAAASVTGAPGRKKA